MSKIQKVTTVNTTLHREVSNRVTALDNRSNKNAERIQKMEEKINALGSFQKDQDNNNSARNDTDSPGCSFWTPM